MHPAAFLLRLTSALILACALAACGGGSGGSAAGAAAMGSSAPGNAKADTQTPAASGDESDVHYAP